MVSGQDEIIEEERWGVETQMTVLCFLAVMTNVGSFAGWSGSCWSR